MDDARQPECLRVLDSKLISQIGNFPHTLQPWCLTPLIETDPVEHTPLAPNSAYAGFLGLVIVFGGVLAPMMELKLGLGGTSYTEFLQSVHLPVELAQVWCWVLY